MHTIIYIDNDNLSFLKYESILTNIFKTNNSFFKIFINEYDFSRINEASKIKHKFIICNNYGKNSLDISLTIECIKDLLNNKNIDTFVLVSNDSDFIPLCKEIKECGKKCILCVDRDYNQIIRDAYNNVINIGGLMKIEYKKIELKKQKDFEEQRRLINVQKTDNEIVQRILNNYFNSNSKCTKISFENIRELFIKNNIDYKKYGKLRQYLINYLPIGYKIQNTHIIKLGL